MAVKITQDGISKLQSDTVNADKIVDGSIGYEDLPSGTIIQVVNQLNATQASQTLAVNTDNVYANSALTITPRLNDSKFIIIVRFLMEVSVSWDVVWNVTRNNARINNLGDTTNNFGLSMATQTYGGATNDSSTPEMLQFMTFDETAGTVAGTPITYRITGNPQGTARTCWSNRCFGAPSTSYEVSTSEIIVLEVKG